VFLDLLLQAAGIGSDDILQVAAHADALLGKEVPQVAHLG